MSEALPDSLVRTVLLYLEDIGTPFSNGVALRLRHEDWDGLADLSPDPRNYLEAGDYARDAAAASLLRKLPELPSSSPRRLKAIEKWQQGERDCFKSNERLCRYLPEHSSSSDRVSVVEEIISSARQHIETWIGPYPPTLDTVAGRFGPGSTFSDRGDLNSVPDKMSSDPSLTRGARWYILNWIGTQWATAVAANHGKLSFVEGNRFTTVPKTALIDRSIAAEPSINVFYQLALGRSLRHRLKRATGWDLDTAQEIHRQVACESSVSREFATLDLANASDTVSRTLVKVLLPHAWFIQLDDLRSKKTLIDGRWVVLEKFSSMGNGFTFELETIIFAALVCAVHRYLERDIGPTQPEQWGVNSLLGRKVFVFGDDIIIRNDYARPLKSVLEFFGFTLNSSKSYYGDEPFRESCGGDYFLGSSVRPYFLKGVPNEPQDFIAFANGIGACYERMASSGRPTRRRAWLSILDQLPTWVRRCRGPSDLGDIVIHDTEDRWWTIVRNPRTLREESIRYIRALVPSKYRIKRYEDYTAEVVLACATYGCGNRDGGVIPRGGLLGYRVGWIPYS